MAGEGIGITSLWWAELTRWDAALNLKFLLCQCCPTFFSFFLSTCVPTFSPCVVSLAHPGLTWLIPDTVLPASCCTKHKKLRKTETRKCVWERDERQESERRDYLLLHGTMPRLMWPQHEINSTNDAVKTDRLKKGEGKTGCSKNVEGVKPCFTSGFYLSFTFQAVLDFSVCSHGNGARLELLFLQLYTMIQAGYSILHLTNRLKFFVWTNQFWSVKCVNNNKFVQSVTICFPSVVTSRHSSVSSVCHIGLCSQIFWISLAFLCLQWQLLLEKFSIISQFWSSGTVVAMVTSVSWSIGVKMNIKLSLVTFYSSRTCICVCGEGLECLCVGRGWNVGGRVCMMCDGAHIPFWDFPLCFCLTLRAPIFMNVEDFELPGCWGGPLNNYDLIIIKSWLWISKFMLHDGYYRESFSLQCRGMNNLWICSAVGHHQR